MTEAKVKDAIKKVITFITRMADSRNAEISERCLSFITSIDTTSWEEAKKIAAPYNLLVDSMRSMYIKKELSFLDDDEVNKVKQYMDFIATYAGV